MATVRRNLGITTMNNMELSNHIVKSLAAAFTLIGKKTRSQDCNVAHHVLAESIVCRSTMQHRLLKCTSQIVPLHPKTLKKYSVTRYNLVEGQMETLWEFSGRFRQKDMKLVEAVKGLVHTFSYDNTRNYSNIKDVLKHCWGSMNNDPHVKHYLDMTQTELFDMFKVSHVELRLGKGYFENASLGMLESIPFGTLVVVDTT